MSHLTPYHRALAIFTALSVVSMSVPAVAEEPRTIEDGDVVWMMDEEDPLGDVPCDLCVSDEIIWQCNQDAAEADRLRRDLRTALFRVELGQETLAEARARHQVQAEQIKDLEEAPGLWTGVAVGAGAALAGVLIFVLVK